MRLWRALLRSLALGAPCTLDTQVGHACPVCKGGALAGVLVCALGFSFEFAAGTAPARRAPRHFEIAVRRIYSTFAAIHGNRPPPRSLLA